MNIPRHQQINRDLGQAPLEIVHEGEPIKKIPSPTDEIRALQKEIERLRDEYLGMKEQYDKGFADGLEAAETGGGT